MKIKVKAVFGGLVLAAAMAGPAHATLLSSLLAGGSITAGDKLFDNWSVMAYTATDGRSFDAGNIDVTALNDGSMDPGPGLRFVVNNNELSVKGDDLYAFVDLMFGFRATVLTPGIGIKGVSTSDFGAFVGSDDLNDGFNDNGNFIREAVGTAAGLQDLGTTAVEFSILDSVSTSKITDRADFAPNGEVWLTKNVLVWATEATDDASIFSFTQRFAQGTVPEPASWLLVALALAGLAVIPTRK